MFFIQFIENIFSIIGITFRKSSPVFFRHRVPLEHISPEFINAVHHDANLPK